MAVFGTGVERDGRRLSAACRLDQPEGIGPRRVASQARPVAGFVTVHMRSAFELYVQPDAGVTGPPRALVVDPLGTLYEGV